MSRITRKNKQTSSNLWLVLSFLVGILAYYGYKNYNSGEVSPLPKPARQQPTTSQASTEAISLMERGLVQDAASKFADAVETDPSTTIGFEMLLEYFGNQYMTSGVIDELLSSLPSLERMLATRPWDISTRYTLQRILADAGLEQQARSVRMELLEVCRSQLRRTPEEASLHTLAGEVLMSLRDGVEEERVAMALSHFETAFRVSKRKSVYLHILKTQKHLNTLKRRRQLETILRDHGSDAVLANITVNFSQVERRANLSFTEFFFDYAMKGIPVVIPDGARKLTDDGSLWDVEFLLKHCSEGHVDYDVHVGSGTHLWGQMVPTGSTSLSTFLNGTGMMPRGETESTSESGASDALGVSFGRHAYAFDNPLAAVCPAVLPRARVPEYFAADYLKRVTNHDLYDGAPSLFLGPAGSSSGLHVDSFSSNFWMGMMQGHKKWTLFPFDRDDTAALLYENRYYDSFAVDVRNPEFSSLPLYEIAHALRVEITVGPGDLIFVPGSLAHQVSNLDSTVALSTNYADFSCLEQVMKEIWLVALVSDEKRVVGEKLSTNPQEYLKMPAAPKSVSWPEFENQYVYYERLRAGESPEALKSQGIAPIWDDSQCLDLDFGTVELRPVGLA